MGRINVCARGLEDSVVLICPFLPNCSPNQNSDNFLIEIGILILKLIWKFRGPREAKTVLRKDKPGIYYLISRLTIKI